MRRIITFLVATVVALSSFADTFRYSFSAQPLAKALSLMADEHPEIEINFIYNELENYKTSARVDTSDPYEALRKIIGFNPIAIIQKGNIFYIEALQHGTYCYTGRAVGTDNEPVVAATVMLLAPKDSAVITYGITDETGRFAIPCDHQNVIAKLTCVGYRTTYKKAQALQLGTIYMMKSIVKLNEVTVEGDNSFLAPDKNVYIPSGRQKKFSQNVADLLLQMSIPQIQVNPASHSITDNGGIPVAVYINEMPATREELNGVRIADVKRVEYLEFPNDPRFHGEKRVINLIMQKYEYGGYTKFSVNENFLTGLSNQENIFSRLYYKRMTYDVFTSTSNRESYHTGSSTTGSYSLIGDDGQDYNLIRKETTDASHFKENKYPVSFRATYAADKIQIRNTIGFVYTGVPVSTRKGVLSCSSDASSYTFSQTNPNHSNSLSYSGSYFMALPKRFYLDIAPRLSYTHGNYSYNYTSDIQQIERTTRENVYDWRIDAFLKNQIGSKHIFSYGIIGGDYLSRLHYEGSASYNDRFSNSFCGGQIAYNYIFKKWSFYIDGGLLHEKSEINGKTLSDTYPFTHINLNFSESNHNQTTAYFQYAASSPGIEMKSSDVLRQNEFMYITGNPLLKNSRHITLNLYHTWIPSKRFSINVSNNFFENFNRQTTIYNHYNNGAAIIRSYINNGNYLNDNVVVNAKWSGFNNKLQLSLTPQWNFYKSTGLYSRTLSDFTTAAQIVAYIGNVSISGYYRSQSNSLGLDRFEAYSAQYHNRNYHSVWVTWAISEWKIRFDAINFFNRGWTTSSQHIDAPLYKADVVNIGTSSHARIKISATYTFGYGKKVNRGNEVGEQSGASSAILK